MSKQNLRKITNDFQDVRLVSLASWRQAAEINPRDRNGPYVVLQEGYAPEDVKVNADEFVLGRSGKWLSLSHFFKMPVADRREEFIFGTAAEIMQVMRDLPSKVILFGSRAETESDAAAAEGDEMAAAFKAARSQPPGSTAKPS
jgi:hypothetical protein